MIRLGIVGAGIMGRKAVEAVGRVGGLVVTAIADSHRAHAEAAAADADVLVTSSVDELLLSPLDAVYLAVPHNVHEELATRVADSGAHLLLEKPMARSRAEAQRIYDRCLSAGVRLMLGFSHRFHTELITARKVLEEGELGTVMLASDVIVESASRTPSWYWDPDAGGGVLALQSHHSFDRLCWLLNDEIVEIDCRTWNSHHNAERGAALLVRFASGTVGTVSLALATSYDDPPKAELDIRGTQGHVRLRTWAEIEVGSAVRAVVQRQRRDDWLVREFTEFRDAILGDRDPVPSGIHGLRAQTYADAATLSAARGEPVDVRSLL